MKNINYIEDEFGSKEKFKYTIYTNLSVFLFVWALLNTPASFFSFFILFTYLIWIIFKLSKSFLRAPITGLMLQVYLLGPNFILAILIVTRSSIIFNTRSSTSVIMMNIFLVIPVILWGYGSSWLHNNLEWIENKSINSQIQTEIITAQEERIERSKTCGVCQEEITIDDDRQTLISCESCEQGYHGNHILENGMNGFCPICHGPLLEGINMNLYEITGIVSGELQFQARTHTIDSQPVTKVIIPGLGLIYLALAIIVILSFAAAS